MRKYLFIFLYYKHCKVLFLEKTNKEDNTCLTLEFV